jgi:glycerol-3-phosphate dehydrogenase
MTSNPAGETPDPTPSGPGQKSPRRTSGDPTRETYDLVIAGGGVYGIMLALEAARRGLSALLVERGDFGGETSRNSLRIVHGGLRYLQTLDLRRFREHVVERRWFMRHFPGFVEPLACLMPLYGKGVYRTSVFRAAGVLNDLLAHDRNAGLPQSAHLGRSRTISAAEVTQDFPLVETRGLQGGVVWYDGFITDVSSLFDQALRKAEEKGARLLCRVEATGLVLEAGRVTGIEAVDRTSGETLRFRTKTVINACGPWSQHFAERCGLRAPGLFAPLIAWNVVFDRPWDMTCAVAVRPDPRGGRFYFLVPWKGVLFAGTGEAPWGDEPGDIIPSDSQLGAFIADLNRSVPGLALQSTEVASVMAGLLPLARPGGSTLASRETIIDHGRQGGPRGIFSISGVKLTTARLVAERVLRRAFPDATAPSD